MPFGFFNCKLRISCTVSLFSRCLSKAKIPRAVSSLPSQFCQYVSRRDRNVRSQSNVA